MSKINFIEIYAMKQGLYLIDNVVSPGKKVKVVVGAHGGHKAQPAKIYKNILGLEQVKNFKSSLKNKAFIEFKPVRNFQR